MSQASQIGYPPVSRSITNQNVKDVDVLDQHSPFGFLEFIKLIKVTFEPETIKNYYSFYLKAWATTTQTSSVDSKVIITQLYRDFIKDLSINYTTIEEREYLSNLDYTNPLELELATPIFTRKLKEIVGYYNNQRELIKNGITERKIKGTSFGLERAIIENIINYIENVQDSRIIYDVERIKEKIFVDIRELYTNDYSFNLPYDAAVYDAKSLDYGADIFLKDNSVIIEELFGDMSDELKSLKEVDDLLDNQRSMSKKYIGTEFHYLSTNSTGTEYVSGALFDKGVNDYNDYQNIYNPTNVATAPTIFDTVEEMGFFRPSNTSLLFVEGKTNSYEVDTSKLLPDSIYYFPDPNVTGNANPVLSFFFDLNFVKRNGTSGLIADEPILGKMDISTHGYTSNITPETKKFVDNLFNEGAVKDSKYDIYGNMFSLLSNSQDFTKSFEDSFSNTPITKNLILDGYAYYDTLFTEGSSFDYSVSDILTYDELHRSGLSSLTEDFDPLSGHYTLNFLTFKDDNQPIDPTDPVLVINEVILDGISFVDSLGNPLVELVSSDDPTTPVNGPITASTYYDTVAEGGVSSYTELTGGTRIVPLSGLDGDLTISPRNTPTNNVNVYDGGWILDKFGFVDINTEIGSGLIEFEPDYLYIPASEAVTTYESTSSNPTDELFIRKETGGVLWIKTIKDGEVHRFTDIFTNYVSRYPSTVVNYSYGNQGEDTGMTEIVKDNGDVVYAPSVEIANDVVDFSIYSDTIFIKTRNYLIIDKISLSIDDTFILGGTTPVVLRENVGEFDKLSNTFRLGGDVYFSTLSTNSTEISGNDFSAVPIIFKYNIPSNTNELIFPLNSSNVDEFEVLQTSTKYINCSDVYMNFSPHTNRFTLTTLLKDLNGMPHLHDYKFNLYPDVDFIEYELHKPTDSMNSMFFADYQSVATTITLSSSPLSTQGGILII